MLPGEKTIRSLYCRLMVKLEQNRHRSECKNRADRESSFKKLPLIENIYIFWI